MYTTCGLPDLEMAEAEAEAEVAAVDVVVKIHMERASQKSHYRTCQIEHSVVVAAVAQRIRMSGWCWDRKAWRFWRTGRKGMFGFL